MDTLWTVVAWLSIGLVALSARSMVRSFRRDRPIHVRTLLVTLLVSVTSLVVFVVVVPGSPGVWAWALGAAGLAGGALVSRSTRLGVVGTDVTGRPSPWLAIQWAALFGVAQLAAVGAVFDTPASGMGALLLGTGVTVGGTAVLLGRRHALAGIATAGSLRCPHCHALLVGGDRCGNCTWRVRTRARRAAWAPPSEV